MEFKRLIALGTIVGTLTSFTFAFNSYQSKDGLIRQGIDNLKTLALQYRDDYMELKAQYDEMVGSLESTQDALAQARLKLEQIYMKITGNAWDSASGDILDFDFASILPDQPLPDNPIDGDAICELLGLPAGSSTADILAAIEDLIATVQTLEARIEVLEAQIAEYESEQNYLVEQLMALQVKLQEAQDEANAIIDSANTDQVNQLNYVNATLEELGGEAVGDDNQSDSEQGDPEVTEEQLQAAEANLRDKISVAGMGIGADNLIAGTAEFRIDGDSIMYYNGGSGSSIGRMSNEKQAAAYNAWVEYNNLLTAYNAQQ